MGTRSQTNTMPTRQPTNQLVFLLSFFHSFSTLLALFAWHDEVLWPQVELWIGARKISPSLAHILALLITYCCYYLFTGGSCGSSASVYKLDAVVVYAKEVLGGL